MVVARLQRAWKRLFTRRPVCDVLLLVTTPSEVESLRAIAPTLGIDLHDRTDELLGQFFDLGVVGASRVFAAQTRMGALGYRASAHTAMRFRERANATAIIQVGMAFGVGGNQRPGDVLVARSIFPYDDRAVRERAGRPVVDYSRTRKRNANAALLRLLEREQARSHPFAVHVGIMLSGGARLYSTIFRDQLVSDVTQVSKPAHQVVGGDMEAVGLLSVSPPEAPLWCVVKGISDFAEPERDATMSVNRTRACENAMRFVLSALLHTDGGFPR